MKIEKARDRRSVVIAGDGILWIMKLALISILLLGSPPHVRSQEDTFPYRLNKSDFVLLPLGAGMMFIPSLIRGDEDLFLSVEEIEELDKSDVNVFDRGAIDNWNRTADVYGDFFFSAMPYLPAAVLLPHIVHAEWKNAATLGVMYLEVYMLTKGLTKLGKALFPRNRPFAYNTDYTAAERYDFQGNEAPEARTSFFSGHASSCFSSAVFLSKVYSDIYGKNGWSYLIWGASLSLASFTAYSRVLAGEHFMTDVLMGAAVGSAVGYFIPVLHKMGSEKASVAILPNSIAFTYRY